MSSSMHLTTSKREAACKRYGKRCTTSDLALIKHGTVKWRGIMAHTTKKKPRNKHKGVWMLLVTTHRQQEVNCFEPNHHQKESADRPLLGNKQNIASLLHAVHHPAVQAWQFLHVPFNHVLLGVERVPGRQDGPFFPPMHQHVQCLQIGKHMGAPVPYHDFRKQPICPFAL